MFEQRKKSFTRWSAAAVIVALVVGGAVIGVKADPGDGASIGREAHAALASHGAMSPVPTAGRHLIKLTPREAQACMDGCMDGEALTRSNLGFCHHSCY